MLSYRELGLKWSVELVLNIFFGDYFVIVAIAGATHGEAELRHGFSYFHHCSMVHLDAGVVIMQVAGYLCGRYALNCCLSWFWAAVKGTDEFGYTVYLTVALVIGDELGGFPIVEPITLPFLNLGEQLGIELVVVNGRRGVDATRDADTEETA